VDWATQREPSSTGFFARFAWPLPFQAVYLMAPLFVLVVAVFLSPITPHDYFWALVQGRAIGQLGRLPDQNLFLFTLPAEAPFFNQPWLAELVLYQVATKLGHGANVAILAACLCTAVAVAMATGLRRGRSARQVAVVALVATPFLAMAAGVRTQLFAFPCFALVAYVVFSDRVSFGRLTMLFAVVAAWTNLHGSFVLAPVLALVAVMFRGRPRGRHAVGLVAATLLGTCAHPAGPRVWAYAISLSGAMGLAGRSAVEEWQHLPLATPIGAGYLVATLVGVGWGIRARKHLDWPGAVVFLGLVAAGFGSQRFVPFAALLSPWALPGAGDPKRVAVTRKEAWIHVGFLFGFGIVALLSAPGFPLFQWRAADRSPRGRMFGRDLPLRLVDELSRLGVERTFHTQAVGGLLEWTLTADRPRSVAFVDQRFELIPPAIWDDYARARNAGAGWEAVFTKHGIAAVLAEPKEAGPLIQALNVGGRWRVHGEEGPFVLYVREN
jgi:hypothetical protein